MDNPYSAVFKRMKNRWGIEEKKSDIKVSKKSYCNILLFAVIFCNKK